VAIFKNTVKNILLIGFLSLVLVFVFLTIFSKADLRLLRKTIGTDSFYSSNDPKNLFANINFFDTDSKGIVPPKLFKESLKPKNHTYRIPVFMYHYVEYNQSEEDFLRDQINIEPHIFEQQILTLKKAGYTFITPNDLSDILKLQPDLSESKYAMLTFDDGYSDFYTDVFPLLVKHDVKAVVFIVPYYLDKQNYMFSWQVKEVVSSGLVELGAHTLRHKYLLGIPIETVQAEVGPCKNWIEEKFGVEVTSFAYPYGVYDDAIVKVVQEAGYETAFGTDLGIEVSNDNKYTIKRIRPGYAQGTGLTGFIDNL